MYHEEWELILADLLLLPTERPILIEGAALLPEIVAPMLNQQQRGIWMVPTPAFQRQYYRQRGWPLEVVAGCTEPAQAFANWMERDIGFATYVTMMAHRTHVPLFSVDGSLPLEASIRWAQVALALLP